MGRNQVITYSKIHRNGDGCRRSRNKPVNEDRTSLPGSLDANPANGGNLETAEPSEQI